MSNKKKRAVKTDWKQVAQSMRDDSGTLYEKLKAIWDLAHRMIKFVEERHPTPIKKVLKRHKAMFKQPSTGGIDFNYQEQDLENFAITFDALYVTLNHLDMDYEDSLITESYFGAIGMLGRIQTKTNFVARYDHECRKNRVDTLKFIEKVLNVDSQAPNSFINDVVPLFFSLQWHCYNLIEIANAPAGAPADPRERIKRARSGGNNKTFGEEVLKGMISNFLRQQNPEHKYKKISSLFNKLEDGLRTVLNDYLAGLGSPIEKGGKPLTYGEKPTLTIDGIQRKLHQWKSKDPEFRKNLEKICILPKEKTP